MMQAQASQPPELYAHVVVGYVRRLLSSSLQEAGALAALIRTL